MNLRLFTIALAMIATTLSTATGAEKTIKIVETTDVHGNYFPYDFIARKPWQGSLSRVSAFVDSLRRNEGNESVILVDCGDILQGQPSAYYYNFIDTATTHLASRIYDFMGYDVATIGNHDVETGHAVYDRWIRQTSVPVLGANIINTATSQPYLPPYKIINRNGVKIAVLGLLTPAIPAWLPENLWEGLLFNDLVESAKSWVDKIRTEEQADVMIGLFHSGRDYSKTTDGMMENASLYVAQNVDGFDAIFYGHDHREFNQKVTTPSGASTLVINPANNAMKVAVAELTLTPGNKLIDIKGALEDVSSLNPSPRFLAEFKADSAAIDKFVSREIGSATKQISTAEAYFGPSAFMQLVHDLQLEISGAEISFAAPLSFDATINEGPLHVSDMFTLYKYENMLYTMSLTGREIKDYLEMAYDLWTNTVDPTDPNAHLVKFESPSPSLADNRLKNPSYNFDSAAGINYEVDITKPKGSKVTILSMANGEPFNLNRHYEVAVNSYRGNGGGDLLTLGAGIPRPELKSRILRSTDKDLRYYLLKAIEKKGLIEPYVNPSWKFVPEALAARLISIDKNILFGEGASRMQK